MEKARLILKSGKDQSVRRYHPWIFSGAVKKITGNPAEGDIVEVFDNKETFLATGHYQPSSIAVRILSFERENIDRNFLKRRIKDAVRLRQSIGLIDNPDTDIFRLINAEGDSLPGLIADFYKGVVVLQMHSAGMFRLRQEISEIIREILEERVIAVFDKSEATMPFMSAVKAANGFISGFSEPLVASENGFKFKIDWQSGQKTGFYIDQRDNRKLLQNFSENRDVLNMFGYTGGFSVYAMKNARLVHTVDSSLTATETANENIRLNFGDDKRHTAFAADAFEFLADIKDIYDLIILDPPAFAKHTDALPNALQGYKRLNMKAIEQIRSGGIIFTFSCSQVVSKENFRKSVFAAAANTGRKVRIIYQLSQPPDHPVNIYHPEGEYLKGLVLHVV